MSTREEYNSCIKKFISGTGKTPEQRRLSFCIGAKICSHKAKTEEEAKKICLLPKPDKPDKSEDSEKKTRKSHKKNDCTPCIGKDIIKALYDGDSDLMDSLMEGPLKDIKKCTEPSEIKFCNI